MADIKLPARKQQQNTTLFHYATELRAHMNRCALCKGADRVQEYSAMCPVGIRLAVHVAKSFDFMIEYRRTSHQYGDGVVYPCPELSAHGEAYALCVEAVHTTAIQERLF